MYQKPVNKVSHVVFCVKTENFAKTVAFWENAYGIAFHDINIPRLGLRVKLAIEAGLEIITPAPDLGPVVGRVADFLATKGEGVYSVVFGIRDMDDAIARAAANGVEHSIRHTVRQPQDPLPASVESVEEAHLAPFMGTQVILGQVEPRQEK